MEVGLRTFSAGQVKVVEEEVYDLQNFCDHTLFHLLYFCLGIGKVDSRHKDSSLKDALGISLKACHRKGDGEEEGT